ncbi:MAG TPA: hypothetical protein VJH92_01235 [Candidatus Nanoarchaeia archaeon]|nr:hypothetical protein [Candidatus Nanoarchaeia archaeon]
MAQAKVKKRFFDVDIPILNKETQLFGYKAEELAGRYILYDLTRLLRGKNSLLKLKVELEEGKPVAKPVELTVLPYFIRKMMRKGTNYVEDSFSTDCNDAQVRLKPFLITRRKVSRAVRKALRDKTKEELILYLKDKSYDTMFQELLRGTMQKTLSLRLKKIYPLSLCEIRTATIEKFLKTELKKHKTQE